jgi:hypothetical protein
VSVTAHYAGDAENYGAAERAFLEGEGILRSKHEEGRTTVHIRTIESIDYDYVGPLKGVQT